MYARWFFQIVDSLFDCYYFAITCMFFFFFSSRRRHTRSLRDWSSDVCSSDLTPCPAPDRMTCRVHPVRRATVAGTRLEHRACVVHTKHDRPTLTDGGFPMDEKVRDCMTPDPVALQATDSVESAAEAMRRNGIG